ncbi:CBO0543 family protein [Lentibacillus sp. L22]|uniref:CBO0543 family protein n=1 Tax=Lentibacillus TaxID=175304 RepID=UPI0022B0A415|nr:CBO0543 family protein [Lentibacillus daqui]
MLFSKVNEMIEREREFIELGKQYFFEQVLFSYQWWLLVCITVGMWILWFILVDRKHMPPILFVGMFSSLIAFSLDNIGRSLHLWFYPYQLTFFSWEFLPVDLAIIPVCYMILYQYIRPWLLYLPILVILALLAAFIVEPLFVLADLYRLIHWKHVFSLPFYIIIGVVLKWVADRV